MRLPTAEELQKAWEGQPDPRYGNENVALQQGHQDPHKPSDYPQNIIPQCQFCNQAYQDNFVFDNKGRVRTTASVQPVKKASDRVQRKIWEWLDKKFTALRS